MRINNKLLALSLLIVSVMSFAGSEGGGGGDAVILSNGEVVLADVFLDRNQPQPNNMPRRISLNPRLLLQVTKYTEFAEMILDRSGLHPKTTNKRSESDILKLFKILGKRESDLVFYAVHDQKELNTYCASGGTKAYKLPDGASVTQVACTSGNEVFLVEPLFRRMNILQQALLLMHERMTTLRDAYGGKNYGAIAGVTSGLGEILTQAYAQQTGNRQILKNNEIQRVGHFYTGFLELEYRDSDMPLDSLDWTIHPKGGAFLGKDSEVDASAFVGITSMIKNHTEIGADAEIVESILNNVKVGKGSLIENSTVTGNGIVIGQDSTIRKSTIHSENATFGRGLALENSTIRVRDFVAGNNLKLTSANINLIDIYGRSPKRRIVLKDNQELSNGRISEKFDQYLPGNVEVEFPSIEGVVKTICVENIKTYYEASNWDGGCYKKEHNWKLKGTTSFAQLTASNGLDLVFDQKVDRKEYRNGFLSKNPITVEVLRSFNFKITFKDSSDMPASDEYTIFNDEIVPAKTSRVRLISLKDNSGRNLIAQEMMKAAESQGIEATFDGYNINFKLAIKDKPKNL